MENCSPLLEASLKRAQKNPGHSFVHNEEIREYARSKYDETGGVEIAILDCIGFLRHFLHLFHRLRKDFLDQYQVLVLREPDSAVSQALKEAFLALRQAAESAD